MKQFFKNFWILLRKAYQGFNDDNGMKLSASLSYYTIFSLSPMLVIIISLASLFYGREAVQGQVYGQIKDLIGSSAAIEVQDMIKNAQLSNHTVKATVIGLITLLLGATGVFSEIQDSINYIWSLKAKPKKGWLKIIINRLLSFSMIVTIGFLLLVALIVNTILEVFSDHIQHFFPHLAVYLFYILNLAVLMVIITFMFAIIFKVLPDGHLPWKDALIGASFTTLLFMVGKFIIGLYLSKSKAGYAYGAAGSLIVILLWVYYSSIILYFGAEFTEAYSYLFGQGIIPKREAVMIEKKEIISDAENILKLEKDKIEKLS